MDDIHNIASWTAQNALEMIQLGRFTVPNTREVTKIDGEY